MSVPHANILYFRYLSCLRIYNLVLCELGFIIIFVTKELNWFNINNFLFTIYLLLHVCM